jgi:hypothetical protein
MYRLAQSLTQLRLGVCNRHTDTIRAGPGSAEST